MVGKLLPNLKLHQIYLNTFTQKIWKMFNADPTWTSYKILSKPKFGQIGPKSKISSDLLEILSMSQY